MQRIKKSLAVDQAATKNPMCDRIVGAAFKAFMENGYAGTSTLEIATRAKVSKRDFYANFDGKEAILLACIASRAARMRLPPDLPVPLSRQMLASTLTTFGAIVLGEVCHPQVVAMFRLAIAEAQRSSAVAKTLNTSRLASRAALIGLFAQAQATGILDKGDTQLMMEQFFALLWGDLMIGRLLDVAGPPKPAEIEQRVATATAAFLKLYPATRSPDSSSGTCEAARLHPT
ncbi:MAG TPA: TetR/AcrR family transcriptional regulator [Stellaceae bacterium]|nr:TetR/AcrR family transcriptional regulator [Stellaceae bacterium]